jgi:hypothetical protein
MSIGAHEFQVAEMLERGATLGEVEDDLISVAPLDADEKAGLWLFAWSLLRRAQRGGRASGALAILAPVGD